MVANEKGVGVGVCALWSEAMPSQNKKRKAKVDKTRGGNSMQLLEGDGWMI